MTNSPSSNIPEASSGKASSRWIISALKDWLELLSGPPFELLSRVVKEENWSKLLKLLALVLLLSGVVLGITVGIKGTFTDTTSLLLSSKPAVVALTIGVALGVIYNFTAYIFGVKISLAKSFFVVLLTLLPWLPILSLLQMLKLPQIDFPLIGIVYVFGHFIFIKPLVNFHFAVVKITRCNKWRVLASILVPLSLVGLLIIYMFS